MRGSYTLWHYHVKLERTFCEAMSSKCIPKGRLVLYFMLPAVSLGINRIRLHDQMRAFVGMYVGSEQVI